MKVLSIKQPWAWLIVYGGKDIENRTWQTKYRGKFLVHASASLDKDAVYRFHNDLPLDLDFGGIIGEVELVDVVTNHSSKWFEGPFGFVLKNPRPLKYIPLKGKLNFFDYDGEIHAA